MPRRKEVPSLLKLCLENVALAMDNFWSKFPLDDEDNGPLESLPSVLLVKLMDLLRSRRGLNVPALEILITHHLEHLNLTTYKTFPWENNVNHALHIASMRCQVLTTLIVSDQRQIVFPNLVSNFSSILQVLDISGTFAGDDWLIAIGASCKALRELNITNCKSVTDTGIKALCVTVLNEFGEEDKRMGQCKQLIKIQMLYTSVSGVGVRSALENLPHLEILESYLVIQVLTQIYRQLDRGNPHVFPKFKLINLMYNPRLYLHYPYHPIPYENGSLAIAVFLCPNIQHVVFKAQPGMNDGDMLALAGLKGLRQLKLSGDGFQRFIFRARIEPILHAVGKSLEKLELSHFNEVSCHSILELCPNLVKLSLSYNSYDRSLIDSGFRVKPIDPSKILNRLTITCGNPLLDNNFDYLGDLEPPYKHLLSFASLCETMWLNCCTSLNDKILQDVVTLYIFPNLKEFDLIACPGLTGKGLDLLLNSRMNPLKFCSISGSIGLTQNEIENWRKLFKKENLEIQLNFHS